jgi:uncharacterized protein YggE
VACRSDTHVSVGEAQTGITVTGTGRVTVVPDIGLLNLGVEVSRPTVAEARAEAASAMDAVRTSLQQNGVEDRDITTQFFNIQPQYGPPEPVERGLPAIIGYTVSNQVTVKVRAVDNISTVLDGAIAAGGNATRVNGVSFTVDEPQRYEAEARDLAMADARARAEQLADLAGVQLGAARAVNEALSGSPEGPFPSALQRGGDTSISPGETEVTLTVSVVYDLE